ncbi:hypothetical protein Acr_00g0028720 [Actinidia rufa]|uniref:Uncharacterized protein n=1 Tax=Actinidia rufa TaxID=165716 RepID=A0A7J0DFP3_9ERIC|nr:hypothetical protein Acr_00g0028720 [Actinidia rufa]
MRGEVEDQEAGDVVEGGYGGRIVEDVKSGGGGGICSGGIDGDGGSGGYNDDNGWRVVEVENECNGIRGEYGDGGRWTWQRWWYRDVGAHSNNGDGGSSNAGGGGDSGGRGVVVMVAVMILYLCMSMPM